MREITTHQGNRLNDHLTIERLDTPTQGGAYWHYNIVIHRGQGRESYRELRFQNGAVDEMGVNGISNEVLLAIIRDRLECFQAGPFPTEENAVALFNIKEAMAHLSMRSQARIDRGGGGLALP